MAQAMAFGFSRIQARPKPSWSRHLGPAWLMAWGWVKCSNHIASSGQLCWPVSLWVLLDLNYTMSHIKLTSISIELCLKPAPDTQYPIYSFSIICSPFHCILVTVYSHPFIITILCYIFIIFHITYSQSLLLHPTGSKSYSYLYHTFLLIHLSYSYIYLQ